MSAPEKKPRIETTGHVWDGIQEYNNPLPRWWLWTFYVTCLWGLIYTVAYPAWPLISTHTAGFLGYSTRAEVAADIAAFEEANAPLNEALAQIDMTTLGEAGDLQHYAVSAGAAIFRNNCSQCHGAGAAGAKGYPNLLDDDWLWGGSITEIAYTIRHGIRNETDTDAHWSQMPAFDGILTPEDILAVSHYVRSLSGLDADPALSGPGQVVYTEQCAVCHMDDGTGDRSQGAPNLADAIWLHGSSLEDLTETITNSRFGVMPPWAPRLSEAEIRAVAAYVHQLGGGE